MIDVAVVGLGKMGLSHLAMARAHPDVNLSGICDSSGYVLDVLNKYTHVPTFTDYAAMLTTTKFDAVIIATPSNLHASMVRTALEHGLHVFCEKPLCLDHADSQSLAALAESRNRVTQVGYHNRFVASFREVKALIDAGAIGDVTHVLAEAYGPVVLKPKGGTWRSKRSSGGSCLYDYAAHPLDLVNWYLGEPTNVGGSVLNSVFSAETDDEVFSTLRFPGGATAQLSVSWSDESQRKMSTKMTLWGTQGRIFADRQEIQVYLREGAPLPEGYERGWNVRYTTELTKPVWFYLRGEEYSAQMDAFVRRVIDGEVNGVNTFASGAINDRAMSMILQDATSRISSTSRSAEAVITPATKRKPWLQRR